MSVDISVDSAPAGQHYNEIEAWSDYVPTTLKRLYNYAVGNEVQNAVDFTNKHATVTNGVFALTTGGASLIPVIQRNPIALKSFQKIAKDDSKWKKYCSHFTFCSVAGNTLRAEINKMTPTKSAGNDVRDKMFNRT